MTPVENQIQRGDLLQRLTRGLEIRGVRSPVFALDSNVSAVVLLEDLTRQSEFLAPKDRSAGVGTAVAAVAAEFGGAALLNPVDSGVIVIVDRCILSIAAAQAFNLTQVPFGTITGTYAQPATPEQWMDQRNAGRPTAQLWTGADVAPISVAAGAIESQRIGSAGPWMFWDGPGIVLVPGRGLVAECLTLNVAFNASFRWREVSEP